MGRLSLLLALLGAVTFCIDAHPYSKLPEGVNLGDGFTSRKSSSSSQASSYKRSTEDKIQIDGVHNGQVFTGSKSSAYSENGGSHSESSSFSTATVNGVVPIGLMAGAIAGKSHLDYGSLHNGGSGFVNHQHGSLAGSSGYNGNAQDAGSGYFQHYASSANGNGAHQQAGLQQTGNQAAGAQFWWMGSNSPFLNVPKPSGGCTPNGCLASATYESNRHNEASGGYAGNNVGQVGIKFESNPFLNGASSNFGGSSLGGSSNGGSSFGGSSYGSSSFGSAGSGSSSFGSSGSAGTSNSLSGGSIDGSKNPFLNGAAINTAGSSSGYGSSGSSVNDQSNLVGGSNSYYNTGSSGSVIGQVPQVSAIVPSVSGNSGNPFFKPQAPQEIPMYPQLPQLPQVNQIPQVSQGQEPDFGDQQIGTFPIYPFPINGEPTKQQPEENNPFKMTCTGQGRVCVRFHECSSDGYVITEDPTEIRLSSQICDLNNQVCCMNKPQVQTPAVGGNGGIFSDGNIKQQPQPDLTTGEGGVPPISNGRPEANGYLPPIGTAPSSNVPAFTNPPKDEEPDKSGGSSSPVSSNRFPPAPVSPLQVGCAAALLCVEEQFCSLEGVITTEPVAFTTTQLSRRVPLSSCKNPDNGVIGKCCRDPNYVDPWPAGNLPANYSGGFDEQGFPTILNIAKTRPTKKRPYNEGSTKNATPTIKTSFSAPNPRPLIPQVVPNEYPRPVEIPQAPYNEAIKSPTPFELPTTQNPFIRNSYDVSSSNQNPTIIAPHVPGGHCGLRNKVQRPNSLNEIDVAFGEIPWQAMVLSNIDKKLLCSGAIIAPNAVVTAARCVEGFNPSNVAIKAGEWKLGYELKHEEPLPFEIINVASIAPYPAFSSGNPANDIAILFLEHDMKLDQHVDTLCLPEGQPRPPQPGRKCIATGWGKTILQVNVAGSLMHSIDVDVLDNEQCLQRISNAETQIPLDDSLICAKAHKQNNNMCQVDFGGPLACDRGDGYYELAGIYNQDTGCLPTNQVATFTTIPTRWIQEMMTNPPRYTANDYQSPVSVGQNPFVHRHGPNEPCNCQELQPSGTSQYLPPV